ncbi:hypothetical protein [Lactiplantibacillus plantarum]|uniref:hypothetical protein n=1 Tax=Lactiplantibacillus plantarum TaxID=1590 RepID=UPI000931462D|nr:hypothetical protein [Lactiplantibacillus plantarum]
MKTETITSVIAVAAIISPVLTTLINNYYNELANRRAADKEKRLELQRQLDEQHQQFVDQNTHIRNIYEKYTEYTFEVISTRGKSSTTEQGKYFGLVLLYVDQNLREKLIDIQSLLLLNGKPVEVTGRDSYQVANSNFLLIAGQLKSLIDKLPTEQKL